MQMMTGQLPPSAGPKVTFYLEPDWLGNLDWVVAVHNYLHAFSQISPCQLWLKADPSLLTAKEALSLIQPLIAPFGDWPFPSLYVSDDLDEAPPPAYLVRLPSSEEDLASWTLTRFQQAATECGMVATT